jgi:NAD(P)-dependent dehydrogenase (short-subunit alcohol dehydrogenase family)
MKDLSGRVVAITGAGSGIGRALAHEFASRGCRLALADINGTSLEDTVNGLSCEVTSAVVDVSNADAVAEWAGSVAKHYGEVHVVVNNAGVCAAAYVADLKMEDFRWVMDINFWGVVNGTLAFLPHLKAADAGHVVNISSIFGVVGVPTMAMYNASKFAVRGFTEALQTELGLENSHVRATVVLPGGVNTNIVQSARAHGKLADEIRESSKSDLVMPPPKAARIIVNAVVRDRLRVLVGRDATMLDLLQRTMPQVYTRIVSWGTARRNRT